MKTAVIGEDADGLVVYNRTLIDLARHFGFHPKACRPYRAQTKGKVERPFRYIRQGLLPGGKLPIFDDLNAQLRHWLDTVADPRTHATTKRVVSEAFAEEQTALRQLPLVPYRAVLKLERRVSHDGMISVGGNAYSVPDTARRRVLDVHCLIDEVQIFVNRHAKRTPYRHPKGTPFVATLLSHGCFFVRLIRAVSSSQPDHSEASRAAAVKHGRRPPRSGARRA